MVSYSLAFSLITKHQVQFQMTIQDLLQIFTEMTKKKKNKLTLLSMMHVNTLCDRLLARFILVAATFLLAAPWNMIKFGGKCEILKY